MHRTPRRHASPSIRLNLLVKRGRLWVGGIALALASCGGDDATGPSYDHLPERYRTLAETVDAQGKRWEANEFSSYQYTYQRICFCAPDWTRPVAIDVADDRIERIVYADDGAPVDSTLWASYHTVDGLFTLIDQAMASDAAEVRVQFDDSLGYPTQLYIDEDLRIADEEFGIEASNVRSRP